MRQVNKAMKFNLYMYMPITVKLMFVNDSYK